MTKAHAIVKNSKLITNCTNKEIPNNFQRIPVWKYKAYTVPKNTGIPGFCKNTVPYRTGIKFLIPLEPGRESCSCHADSFGGFFWNLAAAHLWFTLLGMFFKRTAHLFSKFCTPQAPALRRLSYGNLWNLPSWWVNMPLSEYSDFVQYRLEF